MYLILANNGVSEIKFKIKKEKLTALIEEHINRWNITILRSF